jgi:DNA-binding transcriptional regulator/RsmH inhibitor MraZ
MEELFIGSALCEVAASGEMLLPGFFRETAQQRSPDAPLFIGLHESAPCLIAFDRCYAMLRQYEIAADGLGDQQRLRRTYGFVERTPVDPDGMIVLPPLMRERGHIGDTVLLVATGQRFEIWDLERLLQGGPSDLILLATHHRMAHIANEVLHVSSLPSSRPCHRADGAIQSGVFLQPVSALPPRHDPVGRGTVAQPVEKGSRGVSRDAA